LVAAITAAVAALTAVIASVTVALAAIIVSILAVKFPAFVLLILAQFLQALEPARMSKSVAKTGPKSDQSNTRHPVL
jgi:hypothetical protein